AVDNGLRRLQLGEGHVLVSGLRDRLHIVLRVQAEPCPEAPLADPAFPRCQFGVAPHHLGLMALATDRARQPVFSSHSRLEKLSRRWLVVDRDERNARESSGSAASPGSSCCKPRSGGGRRSSRAPGTSVRTAWRAVHADRRAGKGNSIEMARSAPQKHAAASAIPPCLARSSPAAFTLQWTTFHARTAGRSTAVPGLVGFVPLSSFGVGQRLAFWAALSAAARMAVPQARCISSATSLTPSGSLIRVAVSPSTSSRWRLPASPAASLSSAT